MSKIESWNIVNNFIRGVKVPEHMVHKCISKKDYKTDCNDQGD